MDEEMTTWKRDIQKMMVQLLLELEKSGAKEAKGASEDLEPDLSRPARKQGRRLLL